MATTREKMYPSLLSAYTPHSYQHISRTPISNILLTPISIDPSLLSAYTPHSYQHIPLTPISIYPSLLSAYTPHCYQHIFLTPISVYPSLLSAYTTHSYQHIPLTPTSFAQSLKQSRLFVLFRSNAIPHLRSSGPPPLRSNTGIFALNDYVFSD